MLFGVIFHLKRSIRVFSCVCCVSFTTTTEIATSNSLNNPTDIHGDLLGDLYVVCGFESRVRKISPPVVTPGSGHINTQWLITTVAGAGGTNRYRDPKSGVIYDPSSVITSDTQEANSVRLNMPHDVWIDSSGVSLFIADTYANNIKRVDVKTGLISVYLGAESENSNGVSVMPTAKPSLRPFTFHPISTQSPTSQPQLTHKAKHSMSFVFWLLLCVILFIFVLFGVFYKYRTWVVENSPYTVHFQPSAPSASLLMELINFEAVPQRDVSYL